MMAVFDRAEAIGILERARLRKRNAELRAIIKSDAGLVAKMKASKERAQVLLQLGVRGASQAAASAAHAIEHAAAAQPEDAPVDAPESASVAYQFDEARKQSQRQKDNDAAFALLQLLGDEATSKTITPEQKEVLAKYSGSGGNLKTGDGKLGSAYEYYTPKPIAEGAWEVLKGLGFNGGKVLDPSSGTGIFGAVAPKYAVVDAVELDAVSGRINQLLNASDTHRITVAPFEEVAASTPDEVYDAVITNVPFGSNADRGANKQLDPRYKSDSLEVYFILRSLEKLKPGGLAVFIVPPRCVSGKNGKMIDLRAKASMMAEFMGAYRLPNSVFGSAAADTITDLITFRKFSKQNAEKIAELAAQNPQVLIDANVSWQEFIKGGYFLGEGKRFVLGEFVPKKDPNNKFDRDRVITSASVGEIGKMLRKFPGSRINWDMLNAAPTDAIIYNDGDTMVHAGVLLTYEKGEWKSAGVMDGLGELPALEQKLSSPYTAFTSGATLEDRDQYLRLKAISRDPLNTVAWLSNLRALADVDGTEQRQAYWRLSVIGLAAGEAIERDPLGTNFVEAYPALSDAMQKYTTKAKGMMANVDGDIRAALGNITIHAPAKGKFSGLWSGDVAQEVSADKFATPTQKFDGLRYGTKSIWVDAEAAKAIYGADFNPLTGDDWCVSADGKSITKAADYFVGNYGDVLAKIEADIRLATDKEVIDKLLRMKQRAGELVRTVDIKKFRFTLMSPQITQEKKAEFLRRFVDSRAAVDYDAEKPVAFFDCGSPKTDKDKLLKRFNQYIKEGTVTLGGAKFNVDDAEAIKQLRTLINTANEQFNAWARGDAQIMADLNSALNKPENLFMKSLGDADPLDIPNVRMALRPYQTAYARKMGREFAGINAFGVGLGKTYTALASVQHVHNMGAKKKTAFVVPNSVLSNWKKEAAAIYADAQDCLFVGMTEVDGKMQVKSSQYDADLTTVLQNKHSKIFMTMEAFERIKLKEETVAAYKDYMTDADAAFAKSLKVKENNKADGRLSDHYDEILISDKKSSAPYFEDTGIDSIVIDEAHAYKNSAQAFDYKSAKYLSLAQAAKRGIDMQAKAWYLRGLTAKGDGVLALTATPITNSPQEIYAMLSLVHGPKRVNNAVGVDGVDGFLETVCSKENEDCYTIDGQIKTQDVFAAMNMGGLNEIIGGTVTALNAVDVGEQVFVPSREEAAVAVDLDKATFDKIIQFKRAYRWGKELVRAKKSGGAAPTAATPELIEEERAYQEIASELGEGEDLIGHPFNLISKMTAAIMDSEVSQRKTVYTFKAAQKDMAAKVVAQFNAKKIKEQRNKIYPDTPSGNVLAGKKDKDGDVVGYTVLASALIEGGSVIIDTLQSSTQDVFEELAQAAGLDIGVNLSPKIAAMIANFKNEQQNPRGQHSGRGSSVVKQIIFCDVLASHNKIRMALAKECGVPKSKIAIITGQTNNKPDQIMEVQDGFNAEDEDNKYQVIIANEKAEVGINLQMGTQAIHHLTIGWTPDSIEQRNGRGARQGNKTEFVRVFYYDADGTFDMAKRSIVSAKDSWISELYAGDQAVVKVEAGISNEKLEVLINLTGDAQGMANMQAAMKKAEDEARAHNLRARQAVNLETIASQTRALQKFDEKYVAEQLMAYLGMKDRLGKLTAGIERRKEKAAGDPKDATWVVSAEREKASLEASFTRIQKAINEGLTPPSWMGRSTAIEALHARIARSRAKTNREVAEDVSSDLAYVDGSDVQLNMMREKDAVTSIIAESKAQFIEQSKQDGAYPEAVAHAIADGSGVMGPSGYPLCIGGLLAAPLSVDGGGVVACIVNVHASSGMAGYASLGGIKSDGTYIRNLSRDFPTEKMTPLYEGMQGFDELARLVAEREDVQPGNDEIAKICPAVAKLRKTDVYVSGNVERVKLPAPYFPYVITQIDARVDPILQEIADKQAEILMEVSRWSFKCKASVQLQDAEFTSTDVANQAIEYAIAHGKKFTSKEQTLRWLSEASNIPVSLEQVKGIAQTCANGEEFTGKIEDFIKDAISSFVDVSGGDKLRDILPAAVDSAVTFEFVALNKKAKDEKTLAEGGVITDWVAVQSEYSFTKVVNIREFATNMGKEAGWKNAKGEVKAWDTKVAANVPLAPNGSWVIERVVYDAIVEKYPANCQSSNFRIVAQG